MAVMGRNLARNIARHGHRVAIYNRTAARTHEVMEAHGSEGTFVPAERMEDFVNSLSTPRRFILMVQAGGPTDATIESLTPLLEEGDIVVDGGNAQFTDTRRREAELREKGLHFVGAGISGGEEGALNGPAIMPGGSTESYAALGPILEDIAAKYEGEPCCAYMGPDGAGHYVKMVHNGIEYGDMQLIAEAYSILNNVLDLNAQQLHEIFAEWNKTELESYFIEIIDNIFIKMDEETGKSIFYVILDKAGQKGTGLWTSKNALDLGVPLPLITESVFARCISAMKEERVKASKLLKGPEKKEYSGDQEKLIEAIRQALYMSKICSYAQGFAQMRAQSEANNWNLSYGDIAMIWRGGCIIRAQFLQKIKEAYDKEPELKNLLLDSYFKEIVESYQSALREVVSVAIEHGIPVPSFASAIAYYDSYRTQDLPANLIQAQRDYFGAHTYERKDKEGIYHTNWF